MTFPKRHTVLAAAVGAGATMIPATPALAVGPVTQETDAIAPVTRLAERAHDRAARRHVRLHRTHAKLRGAKPDADRRADVRDWATSHLRDANTTLTRKNRKLRRANAKAQAAGATTSAGGGAATPGHLQSIAACESGGNPGAVDASGTYRGKYQFDMQTWAAVGGSGDPAAASEAEQDKRAAALYAQRGSSPWPVCGG
jgi:hypothetical protein